VIDMLKSKIYQICTIAVISSLFISIGSSLAEELETLQIEIKYTNGDRIDTYQTKYVVYQDHEKTPIFEKKLESNPDTIILPKNHRYQVEVFVNGMFSEVGYVNLQNEPKKLNINIPLSGGIKFNVFFEDGETPIDNVMVVIKSHDGEEQRIGSTNEQGDTMRYWLQSTSLQTDYYTAEVFFDDFLLTSVSNIKVHQGIAQDQKIVVPIPAVVEELITFRLYDTESGKILKNDGNYSILIIDKYGVYLKESSINTRGEIYFSNIPSGVYTVSVLRDEIKDILWRDTKIAITGNQNEFDLFQMNEIEPIAEPIAEPVAEPIAEPVAEPIAEPVAEPFMYLQLKSTNYLVTVFLLDLMTFRIIG